MSEARRQEFDCEATAALLRSLSPLAWASHALALMSGALPILPFWAVTLYYAVRVRFDAELFEMLAGDGAPELVDAWLGRHGERSLEDRCRGGRRLAIKLVAALVAQALATAWILWRRFA